MHDFNEWKKAIRKRLANLRLVPMRESEIVEEMAQHMQDRYTELLASGATVDEARRAVLAELKRGRRLARELARTQQMMPADRVVLGAERVGAERGGAEPVGAERVGARRGNLMADIWRDLRFGARTLLRSRGFTAIAVLSLGLGIGANLAIFQLLDAVLLRSLPVRNPAELYEVQIAKPRGSRTGDFTGSHPELTNAQWEKIRDNQQAFSGMCAWSDDSLNLAQGGEVRNAQALWVSGDFFNVLGVSPILGRAFTPDDDKHGCALTATVISYSFWQREFGGAADVVGKKLTLGGHTVEVIGVTPASFFGLEVGRSFDVAVPICAEPVMYGEEARLDQRNQWWLGVAGRMKPGWSQAQASAQLKSISPGLFQDTLPSGYDPPDVKSYLEFNLAATPAGIGVSSLRKTYGSPLWFLMAITGLVLLIACANLANLMLARASGREREIAVRLALGAARGRIIRQLLAEGLLLAVAGAAAGGLLAEFLSRFLVSFISTQRDAVFVDLKPDWVVVCFTLGVALLTCLLFALAPAVRASRIGPGAAMKADSRGLTANRERFGLRRFLIVSQVALSLVLMVAAMLFARSLQNALSVDPGYREDGVLVANLDLSRLKIPAERRLSFKRDLLDRVGRVAGVASAADTSIVPISGGGWNSVVVTDNAEDKQEGESLFSRLSAGYFRTLAIPILAGRDFDERDTAGSTKVAIVNEAFARQFLGGADPLGKRFHRRSSPEVVFEVVGLAKNTKYLDLEEDFPPIAYLPVSQDDKPGQSDALMINSSVPLPGLMAAVRATIAEVSPEITVDFRVFKNEILNSLLQQRLMATLASIFGLLAAVLATIGLYGVMSYAVAQRRNEVGIRMALGANRGSIVTMILREAGVLLGIGLAVGTVLALFAAPLAKAMLYGLKPTDPLTLAAAVGVLALVGVAAALIPARRAASQDPMSALRYE
jgi:putative ABC transport system permease protein